MKPARVSTPPSRGRLHWVCVSRSRRFTPPSISSAPEAGGEQPARGVVELVFEFARQLLDGVLGGDQADSRAILVHHDGHVAAALLEFADEVEDGFGLRDDKNVAHDLAQTELDERGRTSSSVGHREPGARSAPGALWQMGRKNISRARSLE